MNMAAEQVGDFFLVSGIGLAQTVKLLLRHAVFDEMIGNRDVEGHNHLPDILHSQHLRQERQPLLLEGPSGVIQHNQCKPVRQKRVVLPAEVVGVGARIVVAPQDVDVVFRQYLRQAADCLVMVGRTNRNQIAHDQRNIVLPGCLQGTGIYLHIVRAQSLASGIADDADRTQSFYTENRLLYGYNFVIIHLRFLLLVYPFAHYHSALF